MTRLAVCFLLVFGELAFGGMIALAVPPFFKIERGFYKSSASVYLASAVLTMTGLAALASRAAPGADLKPGALWTIAAIWFFFCAVFGLYIFTLWTEDGWLRARSFSLALGAGLLAVVSLVMLLKPASLGLAGSLAYAITAATSSAVLGLASGAMMFGHWYLIDLGMPVEYLRNFVRLLVIAVIVDLFATAAAVAMLATLGGAGAALGNLFGSHLALVLTRLAVGPAATIVLAWMTLKTLRIPQTMAATGLLYIAVMSVMVGEMLGRLIMFRTALPL